ncbi:MAG: HD domain-containing protein [Candidatus Pacebacteria bacterium]|nr:HD domain-containing protein [Candidatus Paceibacterota bacterium]
MAKEQVQKAVDFIFEMNQLKREYRRGMTLTGVQVPDTIAEHALRAAQIGFVLASMENERAGKEIVSAEKVASILIIHDNAEARVGDQHKVGARYMDNKEGGAKAFMEQIEGLGGNIEDKWKSYMEEFESRDTKEGIVAKDADWLETAFQAKEYLDLGYESAIDWILNVEKAVETESAKEIIAVMKETEFTAWWKGLKKMTYEKLGK